jgi:hypothetical protein
MKNLTAAGQAHARGGVDLSGVAFNNVKAGIANSLWLASNVPAWQRFRRALRNPGEVQLQLLRQYLAQKTRIRPGARPITFARSGTMANLPGEFPSVPTMIWSRGSRGSSAEKSECSRPIE